MENQEKTNELLGIARSLIGKPYKYGAYLETGDDPESFDCSSFSQYVFRQIGVDLPRSSILQATAPGEEIPDLEQAKQGDVIFFEGNRGHYRHDLFKGRKIYVGHLGIYLGNNEIIHATNNSVANGVVIQKIPDLQKEFPEAYKIVIIKRFI